MNQDNLIDKLNQAIAKSFPIKDAMPMGDIHKIIERIVSPLLPEGVRYTTWHLIYEYSYDAEIATLNVSQFKRFEKRKNNYGKFTIAPFYENLFACETIEEALLLARIKVDLKRIEEFNARISKIQKEVSELTNDRDRFQRSVNELKARLKKQTKSQR